MALNWDEPMADSTMYLIYLALFILLIFSGRITAFFNWLYALGEGYYWRYMYNRHAKKGTGISLASFRQLYILNRMLIRQETRRRYIRQIIYFPLRVMGPLSDLLQSRTFEDWRLRYAQFFNLSFYRQYLDYHQVTERGESTIRIESASQLPGFTILTLSHYLADKTNMPQYVRSVLNTWLHLAKESVSTQKLDPHHLRVIISLPGPTS